MHRFLVTPGSGPAPYHLFNCCLLTTDEMHAMRMACRLCTLDVPIEKTPYLCGKIASNREEFSTHITPKFQDYLVIVNSSTSIQGANKGLSPFISLFYYPSSSSAHLVRSSSSICRSMLGFDDILDRTQVTDIKLLKVRDAWVQT